LENETHIFHRKLESGSRKGSEKPKVVGASREARSDRKTCKGEDFGSESSPRGRIEIRNFHGREEKRRESHAWRVDAGAGAATGGENRVGLRPSALIHPTGFVNLALVIGALDW